MICYCPTQIATWETSDTMNTEKCSILRSDRREAVLHYLFKAAALAALIYLSYCSLKVYSDFRQDLRLLLLVIGDGLTVMLALMARRSFKIMRDPGIMVVTAVTSIYFVLLELKTGIVILPYVYGKYIQMIGISLQIWAKYTIGRSFGLLPANRGVVVSGPYRIVRHPMYLGYFISHVGFLLCTFSFYNLMLYVVLYVLVIYRLMKEEELLMHDPLYRDYATKVRYRWIPFLF